MSEQEKFLRMDQDSSHLMNSNPPGYPSDEPQVILTENMYAPGQFQPAPGRGVEPSMTTIYLSIFAMLFFCWPCGLAGLLYSIQGMRQHYRGQISESRKTDSLAKKWTICGIVSGVICVASVFIIAIINIAIIIYSGTSYSHISGANHNGSYYS